jgi:hypothetical protein
MYGGVRVLITLSWFLFFCTGYSAVSSLTDITVQSVVRSETPVLYNKISPDIIEKIQENLESLVLDLNYQDKKSVETVWKKITHHLRYVDVDQLFFKNVFFTNNSLFMQFFFQSTFKAVMNDVVSWTYRNQHVFFEQIKLFFQDSFKQLHQYYIEQDEVFNKRFLKRFGLVDYTSMQAKIIRSGFFKSSQLYHYPFKIKISEITLFNKETLITGFLLRLVEIKCLSLTLNIVLLKKKNKNIHSDKFYKIQFNETVDVLKKLRLERSDDIQKNKKLSAWLENILFFAHFMYDPPVDREIKIRFLKLNSSKNKPFTIFFSP